MKILIIGSGGREHAIAWKLSQNPKVENIYTAATNCSIRTQLTGFCAAFSAHRKDKRDQAV